MIPKSLVVLIALLVSGVVVQAAQKERRHQRAVLVVAEPTCAKLQEEVGGMSLGQLLSYADQLGLTTDQRSRAKKCLKIK